MVFTDDSSFDEQGVIHELLHFLPAQAPLKDFIHHNTLHAFQHLPFHKGVQEAALRFGYKVSYSIEEYRALYAEGRIDEIALEQSISRHLGDSKVEEFKHAMLYNKWDPDAVPLIGLLRGKWREHMQLDLDGLVHPLLFRVIGSFLDQGISIWSFPLKERSFLEAVREIERHSISGFFKTKRVKDLLYSKDLSVAGLLHLLVGDEKLFKQYLFDQQFSHQGWSGMVGAIESNPGTLLDGRKISLREIILFELLLELDAIEYKTSGKWFPLCEHLKDDVTDLFGEIVWTEKDSAKLCFQEAFEWTYYNQVLNALVHQPTEDSEGPASSFQAIFCIDDRECSLRRALEKQDPNCKTFGTPGFFGVEFYFQPAAGKFFDKHCPMPVTPHVLIKEVNAQNSLASNYHFSKHTNGFLSGWIISQTLGFWSAVKLFLNIFKPNDDVATSNSFSHMDAASNLTIENRDPEHCEHNLRVGFTTDEMTDRVEKVLRSIGLTEHFSPLVYIVGHGASSVNNPHFAAYDCGACSGRPGSVNARVFAFMANHPVVRAQLKERGIDIPTQTYFVSALHDTTRDQILYYDLDVLTEKQQLKHKKVAADFEIALEHNANERARRFELIKKELDSKRVHEKIKQRSISIFEPRPELNHATNALCIVGRRDLTKRVFLDRRAFLNSYDPFLDTDGSLLFNIVKAAAPVCGGINLEYYFSATDNQKLGAGSKLPHNVMGLIAVANGIDGDLRPGLPSQMIEVHDPVRLLMIIEQEPDIVLHTIQRDKPTYEWFDKGWIHLCIVSPSTRALYRFESGHFLPLDIRSHEPLHLADLGDVILHHQDNLPVCTI